MSVLRAWRAFCKGVLGVVRGQRVACLSTNRIEYIDLYFACGKIGAVLVPLNFRLPTTAILELMQDCRPKLFVYESAFADTAEAVKQQGIESILMQAFASDDPAVVSEVIRPMKMKWP